MFTIIGITSIFAFIIDTQLLLIKGIITIIPQYIARIVQLSALRNPWLAICTAIIGLNTNI